MNLTEIITSAILFLAIDSVYLTSSSNYFNKLITKIQGESLKLDLIATGLCYVFLIIGINYFIISQKKSIWDAMLLGLVVYGVYETTTKATLRKWDWQTVLIDTLWGGILFALTTLITYHLLNIDYVWY